MFTFFSFYQRHNWSYMRLAKWVFQQKSLVGSRELKFRRWKMQSGVASLWIPGNPAVQLNDWNFHVYFLLLLPFAQKWGCSCCSSDPFPLHL